MMNYLCCIQDQTCGHALHIRTRLREITTWQGVFGEIIAECLLCKAVPQFLAAGGTLKDG